MDKLAAEDAEAILMIRRAGLQPSVEHVSLLGTDIYNVASELYPESETIEVEHIEEAARILKGRIGGLDNLPSYLRTLAAGAKRGDRRHDVPPLNIG